MDFSNRILIVAVSGHVRLNDVDAAHFVCREMWTFAAAVGGSEKVREGWRGGVGKGTGGCGPVKG